MSKELTHKKPTFDFPVTRRIRDYVTSRLNTREDHPMLKDWTHSRFAENQHTSFVVEHPRWGNVTVELVSVSDLRETARQRMFSLVFRGPLEQPLEQGLYPMTHAALGAESLFLVPIGREADGFRYEAVFNNLLGGER
jgi:hypothetical protein